MEAHVATAVAIGFVLPLGRNVLNSLGVHTYWGWTRICAEVVMHSRSVKPKSSGRDSQLLTPKRRRRLPTDDDDDDEGTPIKKSRIPHRALNGKSAHAAKSVVQQGI